MGFDLYVTLNTHVDPETGAAFVYAASGGSTVKKPFMSRDYIVPEMFRHCLQQRGPWFMPYVKRFGDYCNTCDAETFLHYYPEWKDVKKDNGVNNSDWTREDHNRFKAALEWLASMHVYGLSWSY